MKQFSTTPSSLIDDHVDDHVDTEIQRCLSSEQPQSFFMFASAGSGKTRSLIKTLEYIDKKKGRYLTEHGKHVAVITYTNAACDEINRRLQYKPIFVVSTIHSFLWELIKNFQSDIKNWIKTTTEEELSELNQKHNAARTESSAKKTAEKITIKKERLEKIKNIKRFNYNPNGDNLGFNSLSHDEIIKMGAQFIETEETMQQILVNKYPILLIDESQDTKKELVDALLEVYKIHKGHWAIGMFGDTMQKIYMDGKDHLVNAIPKEWSFPEKIMNHRSSKRVVCLANAIRKLTDAKEQRPRSDSKDGIIRLFIVNAELNKELVEKTIANKMAELSTDQLWKADNGYKCLILEHHMAASRFAFKNLFTPLDESKIFADALRKGEITEISFLANTISPLIKAHKKNDAFEIAKLVRKSSPILSKKNLELHPDSHLEVLKTVEESVESLFALWNDGKIPSCLDILRSIRKTGLYELPERVDDIIDETYSSDDPKINALKTALAVPFDEMERYAKYVSDQTRFATHQGVKGLEFPRVMLVLDDSEARGFLFSYEKLFGAKEKTKTDLENEISGKDTTILRTARLFYVACTRAMDSLAVVAYSKNPELVKSTALSNDWFLAEEIEMIETLENIQ